MILDPFFFFSSRSIEDRYKAICHAARTRSVLSLGLACYKKLDGKVSVVSLNPVQLQVFCVTEYILPPSVGGQYVPGAGV